MMPYYDGTLNTYIIQGLEVKMTEEQAEKWHEENPGTDVRAAEPDVPTPFPDEAAEDYLNCSCPPDPPNQTATLCASCRAYFSTED